VVLSSRELAAPPVGAMVERMSGNPSDIVAALAARGIRHITSMAESPFSSFYGLDSFNVSSHPRAVLIGSGTPLFGGLEHDVALTHVNTRHFASGLVQSEYAVVG
jgi:hypothetical protein